MGRRYLIIICILLMLAMPVSALSGITSGQSQTQVSSNGSCDVSLTVTLHLDSPISGLVFPLPESARDITVNGVSAKSAHAGHTRNVELSDLVPGAGTYTLVFRYHLPDTVTADSNGDLFLTLQLLSGFQLPVDDMSFSVILPGAPEYKPSFASTYHLETVESILDYTVTGNTIAGTFTQRLQDQETVTMTLQVSPEQFPQSMSKLWSMDTVDLLMIGAAVLALLYWLAAMRCPIPRRIRHTSAPDGITAGEVGCHLTGAGVDLTLMVLSWAQMGYLLIQYTDSGRVLLHKRMDMGNERSQFENRYFRILFKNRRTREGTGDFYAHLCREAKRANPGIRSNFHRNSGNPYIFRVVMALIGTLSGISLAMAFAADTGWRVVLGILLGILGSVVAWLLQSAAMCLHRRDKLPALLGLGSGLAWLLLSIGAGEWNVAAFVIPAQLLAGLAAAYGGLRTEDGMQNMSEILGLRRYLKELDGEDLARILKANPRYYYDIAPYAMALDLDRTLASHIGKRKLPACDYLTTGMDGHMTAREWNRLLRRTVDALDALQKRLPLDILLGKI